MATAGSTSYEIAIRLGLRDEAAPKVKQLNNELDKTSKKAKEAASGFSQMNQALAVAAGYVGVHKAYEALIGFNAEMQQIKTSLTGIVMMNMDKTWEASAVEAKQLVDEFTRFAMISPTTTKELSSFSQAIAAATFGSGGSMQDFITLTEQGVIASRMFGIETHLAEVQMQEMLLGNVRKTERFTMLLLAAGKMSIEAFRELDAKQRVEFLKKTLTSEAFKRVAAEMGQNWAGVTTTLIDNVQLWLGSIGKGLFAAITEEIRKINQYVEHNRKDLEATAKAWGEGLVSAFKTIRDIVTFVLDHKEVLLGLAAAWKLGVGGGIAGAAGQTMPGMLLSGLFVGEAGKGRIASLQNAALRGVAAAGVAELMGAEHWQAGAVGILGAASKLPGALGAVATAATLAAEGPLGLSNLSDAEIKKRKEAGAKVGGIEDLGRKFAAGKLGTDESVRYLSDIARRQKQEGYVDVTTGAVDLAAMAKTLAQSGAARLFFPERESAEAVAALREGKLTLGQAWAVMSKQLAFRPEEMEAQRGLEALAAARIA